MDSLHSRMRKVRRPVPQACRRFHSSVHEDNPFLFARTSRLIQFGGVASLPAVSEHPETNRNLFVHNTYGISQLLLVAWLRSVFVTRRRGEPMEGCPCLKKGLYSTYQHQSQ